MGDDKIKSLSSQFACIGAGLSGICLGATLKRWYGITDIRIFERHEKLGGTWHANQYPGAACDVPGALYMFSFPPSYKGSRILPSRSELWEYQNDIAEEYSLHDKIAYGATVEKCTWDGVLCKWTLQILDQASNSRYVHHARFLFGGTGILVHPQSLDVPGVSTFSGPIFHSSQWRSDIDLKGKDVVVFGNGCTACQLVPEIISSTKHLTQMIRSKHWIASPVESKYTPAIRWLLNHVPNPQAVERFLLIVATELESHALSISTTSTMLRSKMAETAKAYIKKTAPPKYHDLLIPSFEYGCNRRINDAKYLQSLHSDNLTLTDEPALEIIPTGVRTAAGTINADAIVLANGFQTNNPLDGITITGRDSETLRDHWAKTFGGPGAYNSSQVHGFPNLFFILGPNTTTGHTSTTLAIENSINYALRIIRLILDGKALTVEPKRDAEIRYVQRIQRDLQRTVWATGGCNSWYVTRADDADDDGNGMTIRKWNGMTNPYSEIYSWYRAVFPKWSELEFKMVNGESLKPRWRGKLTMVFLLVIVVFYAQLYLFNGYLRKLITR